MRAAREHPRLVAAQIVGVLCILGCAFALGLLLGGGDGDDEQEDRVARSTQLRLITAERTRRGDADALRETRALLTRSREVRTRMRARLRNAVRDNVKLRRDLRVVRRALLRERDGS